MKIIFFDGYCSLCNNVIDWIMKHDRSGEIQFASLQGQTARTVLPQDSSEKDLDTVLYFRDGKILDRSTAAIVILKDLGFPWSLGRIFLGLPKSCRDSIYKIVARNRYRWFPRRETCRVPTPNEKGRLLP